MLSLFPELLFLSPFAALALRIALAGMFAYAAWHRLHRSDMTLKAFGVADGLIAILLLVGAWTQLAAIAAAVCATTWLVRREWNPYPKSTTILILIIAVCMLVTGPGPFAFDLPL